MIRWFLKLASTRPGAWFFLNVSPPLDRALLRLTRGRFSMAGSAPILLLNTTGARSGQPRSTPLLYLADGERFVLIASKGGAPRHPAWYHNLRAKPEATLLVAGREVLCSAHEAQDEERERLWKLATDYNPGYDTYQDRANRRIPVMVLTPGKAESAAESG
jgi:deazaflavin-dependent oxidoreductase (nitroreductase family)